MTGLFSEGNGAGRNAEVDRLIDGGASDRPIQVLESYLHTKVAAISLLALC